MYVTFLGDPKLVRGPFTEAFFFSLETTPFGTGTDENAFSKPPAFVAGWR